MNADVTVRDVMDREYLGVSESDDLVDTVELLLREGLDTAVVLRGEEPVGVLTPRDVMAAVVEGPDPQTASVGEAMTQSVPTVAPDLGLREAADAMSTQDVRRLVVTANGAGGPEGVITAHDVFAVQATEVEHSGPEDDRVPAGPGAALAADVDSEPADDFEDQGICEACGTLTGDLVSFNGQLLCADCRDM
ncbi:MAG: CBS domain-containing protein [Salinirussus sp.]